MPPRKTRIFKKMKIRRMPKKTMTSKISVHFSMSKFEKDPTAVSDEQGKKNAKTNIKPSSFIEKDKAEIK